MKYIKIYIIISFIFSYCHNYIYYTLLPANYSKLEVYNNSDDSHIYVLQKNSTHNYSINDGIYIDYTNITTNPIQLHFAYKINNTDNININKFEGCNIRLTSIKKDILIENNYLTHNSDIIHFRVRKDESIYFNDIPIYLMKNISNFGIRNNYNDYINVDIFIKWEDEKVFFFLEGKGQWNVASDTIDHIKVREYTDFYHERLNTDNIYNKIILYNFSPESSCIIKDIKLCTNFCNNESKEEYMKYLYSEYITYNVILMAILLIILD